jgi:hypothetical protein
VIARTLIHRRKKPSFDRKSKGSSDHVSPLPLELRRS